MEAKKYKYVYKQKRNRQGKQLYKAQVRAKTVFPDDKEINKYINIGLFEDDREAARAVDLFLIKNNKKPVNGIFKTTSIKK